MWKLQNHQSDQPFKQNITWHHPPAVKTAPNKILSQEQARFQEHRCTVKQRFTLWELAEKHVKRQNKRIAQTFIDYKKVFDHVWHAALFQVLDHYGIPTKLHNLIANLYNRAVSAVKCSGHVGEWFRTTMGSRQGCILSPDLFNIYIENIMSLALDKTIGVGVLAGGHLLNNLQFAGCISSLAESADDLQHLLDSVSWVSLAYGMEICAWVKNMKLSASNSMEMTWNKSQNLPTWAPAWKKTTQTMPTSMQELPMH